MIIIGALFVDFEPQLETLLDHLYNTLQNFITNLYFANIKMKNKNKVGIAFYHSFLYVNVL